MTSRLIHRPLLEPVIVRWRNNASVQCSWRDCKRFACLYQRWADCETFQSESSPDLIKSNPIQSWPAKFLKIIIPIQSWSAHVKSCNSFCLMRQKHYWSYFAFRQIQLVAVKIVPAVLLRHEEKQTQPFRISKNLTKLYIFVFTGKSTAGVNLAFGESAWLDWSSAAMSNPEPACGSVAGFVWPSQVLCGPVIQCAALINMLFNVRPWLR